MYGWDFEKTNIEKTLHATEIRHEYFHCDSYEEQNSSLPMSVDGFLKSWIHSNDYIRLREEYNEIDAIKEMWKSAPFPPVFVTVDALVITEKMQIVLIKRGGKLGNGLYALPGGYINEYEPLNKAVLRELKEETGLVISEIKTIIDPIVVSTPFRSLRGRTITNLFSFCVNDTCLTDLKAGDDASEAFLMPINDLYKNRNMFFEEHYQMIRMYLQKILHEKDDWLTDKLLKSMALKETKKLFYHSN